MSLFNSQTLVITRKTPGTFTKGKYVSGTASTFSVRCSFQPANGDDLQALPEGKRTESVYKGYTSTELFTTDQNSGRPSDLITFNGQNYEINEVGIYQNGLIPHYKIIATRVKETV